MSAEVLYRKWRPRSFAELAGQDAVVRTLTNAVKSGKFAHAYLFSGPRGTGKTTAGRLVAKAVNCTSPEDGEPCNECVNCQAYSEGRALDLIELDAASNRGIDEIRSLREKANFAPAGGANAYKVYLIDEVHMLTEPAFNALLKTLEEPPAHVIFVLATTEAHKVPATVVSRCQRFDFRRISLSAIVERLSYIAGQEQIVFEPEALEIVARTATGSLRDAINLMEQLVDSYGKTVTFGQAQEGLGLVVDPRSSDVAAHAVRGELPEGLAAISAVRDDGLDLRQFQRQVVTQLRGLLLAKAGASGGDTWSEEQIAVLGAIVADVPAERIVVALRAFGEADLRSDPLSPLPLELALATTVLAKNAPPPPETTQPVRSAQARPAPPPAVERSVPAAQAAPKEAPAKTPAFVTRSATKETPAAASNGGVPEAPIDVPAARVPSNVASSADVEEIRARWQDIYQRARELHYKAGALLNSGCGIISATPDEIVFGFRHAMLLDRMQGDGGENIRALQQAVDDVLGAGRTVRCVLDASVDVQRPSRGGHLVRAAEELGGEVLSSDD
jgi:DNA polymerase-3 subunit gamma/tau